MREAWLHLEPKWECKNMRSWMLVPQNWNLRITPTTRWELWSQSNLWASKCPSLLVVESSTTSVRIKSQESYLLINSKEDTVLKFCINLNVAFHVVERNTCKFDESFAAKAVLGLMIFFFTDIFQHNSLDKIVLIELAAFKIRIMKTSSH